MSRTLFPSVIIYQTEDGLSKLEVNLQNETVWLTIDQMAELFQRDKATISRHINKIFKEGELIREATVAFFATVQNIVQNKLHYAAHGHTAAKVIYERADAEKPFMGLTSFAGELPALKDIGIAKNYL